MSTLNTQIEALAAIKRGGAWEKWTPVADGQRLGGCSFTADAGERPFARPTMATRSRVATPCT
jgi:hypothetical protein